MQSRFPHDKKDNAAPIKNAKSFHVSPFLNRVENALAELADLYDSLERDRYQSIIDAEEIDAKRGRADGDRAPCRAVGPGSADGRDGPPLP